jgi:DNA-binding transcriptional MerR regulator
MMDATVRIALLASVGETVKGAIPIHAALLSHEVVRAMFLSKLKMMAKVVLVLSVLGAGAGGVAYHGSAEARQIADSGNRSSPKSRQSESRSDQEKTPQADPKQALHPEQTEKKNSLAVTTTKLLQTVPPGRKRDLEQRLQEVEEKLEQLLRASNAPPIMAETSQRAHASTRVGPEREPRDVERRLQRLEEKLDKVMHLLEASRKPSP